MSINEKNEKTSLYTQSITGEVCSEVEYDGHDMIDVNRNHAGSSFLAYFNVVCVVAGTGTLGLPFALGQGGWIGILIIILAWTMSIVSASRSHTGIFFPAQRSCYL